jgi:hypothetical protein
VVRRFPSEMSMARARGSRAARAGGASKARPRFREVTGASAASGISTIRDWNSRLVRRAASRLGHGFVTWVHHRLANSKVKLRRSPVQGCRSGS